MDDDSELRLEVLHMAADMLAMHGAYGPQEVLDVADIFLTYIYTGNRPSRPDQPTLN